MPRHDRTPARSVARAAAPALLPAAVLGGGLVLSLIMVLHAMTMY